MPIMLVLRTHVSLPRFLTLTPRSSFTYLPHLINTNTNKTMTTNRSSRWFSNVSYLRHNSKPAEVYLVGTMHISKASAEEVRSVIRQVKPDAIFVELCKTRAEKMAQEIGSNPSFSEGFMGLLKNLFSGGGPRSGLGSENIKFFYSFLRVLGFNPGGEFKVAMEEAKALGAKLILGDQPVEMTTRGIDVAWRQGIVVEEAIAQAFMQTLKTKLFDFKEGAHFWETIRNFVGNIDKLANRQFAQQSVKLMKQFAPALYQVLVEQRDNYMFRELEKAIDEGARVIVVVVGLAHMDGLEERWNAKTKTAPLLLTSD